LDPALLRPGRIDKKVQYKLATKAQASALFTRFFAELYKTPQADSTITEKEGADKIPLATLAEKFAEDVPDHEFSTAELQGFLLSCKKKPDEAVAGVSSWVEQELMERQEKEVREAKRKEALREKKDKREVRKLEGTMARLGGMKMSMMNTAGLVTGGPLLSRDVSPNPPSPSPAYEDGPGKAGLGLPSVAPNDMTETVKLMPNVVTISSVDN
jgi:chaperone BCS1